MADDGMGLFDLAERRLAWIDRRQGLLAQNIANANTPGYVARDLQPFAQTLARVTPGLSLTDPMHLQPPAGSNPAARARAAERAPDGNAVSMDVELTKVADTDGAHALVTNLFKKYLGMYRTVIGK